ncbi:sodium:solute symporter family transporter [Saliniramus fredricksonii]|uniref:sodium:solute symporter family transporter n=1 Tax=Saliniramus fredricksonii TaxID=1653334 RepID=UPI0030B800E4
MIAGWVVVGTALIYLCLLFAVAFWGDRQGKRVLDGGLRATVYALGLAVYCTSWTFFGSVGLATHSGLDFLAVYLGPILVIGLGYKLIQRIVSIARAQNITSVADFVAARYGKSERVAAIVSLIAVVGSVPYIALQLKAVSSSLNVFLATDAQETLAPAMVPPSAISPCWSPSCWRSSPSGSVRATPMRRSTRTGWFSRSRWNRG